MGLGRWIFFIQVLFFAFEPKLALAQNFLEYSQFQALTSDQKVEYIESLQKLTTQLSENPHLSQIALELRKNQIFLQLLSKPFFPHAEAITLAERTRICSLKSARHLSNEELFSKVENIPNCTEITSKRNKYRARYMSSVPERLYVLTAELKDRLSDGRVTRKTKHLDGVIGRLEDSLHELRTRGTMDGRNYQVFYTRVSLDLNTIHNLRSKLTHSSPAPNRKMTSTKPASGAKAQAETVVPKNQAARPQKEVPQKLPEKKVASVTSDSSATLNQQKTTVLPASPSPITDSENAPYCLYAGFVIPKSQEKKCQPYKKLPELFAKSILNPEQFLCANTQEIICNPLLFGFVTGCGSEKIQNCVAKKPVCVARSATATKDCWNLAKEKNTMAEVLKIWQSPEGEKLYQGFVHSLESLCDSQNLEARKLRETVKADIVKTCEVAFQVFKENSEKKFLPSNLKNPSPQKSRSVQSLEE